MYGKKLKSVEFKVAFYLFPENLKNRENLEDKGRHGFPSAHRVRINS